jgi:hypothetical protein
MSTQGFNIDCCLRDRIAAGRVPGRRHRKARACQCARCVVGGSADVVSDGEFSISVQVDDQFAVPDLGHFNAERGGAEAARLHGRSGRRRDRARCGTSELEQQREKWRPHSCSDNAPGLEVPGGVRAQWGASSAEHASVLTAGGSGIRACRQSELGCPCHLAPRCSGRLDSRELPLALPIVGTGSLLSSSLVVEARDLDEALAVAAKIPAARFGSIEGRPIMKFS